MFSSKKQISDFLLDRHCFLHQSRIDYKIKVAEKATFVTLVENTFTFVGRMVTTNTESGVLFPAQLVNVNEIKYNWPMVSSRCKRITANQLVEDGMVNQGEIHGLTAIWTCVFLKICRH